VLAPRVVTPATFQRLRRRPSHHPRVASRPKWSGSPDHVPRVRPRRATTAHRPGTQRAGDIGAKPTAPRPIPEGYDVARGFDIGMSLRKGLGLIGSRKFRSRRSLPSTEEPPAHCPVMAGHKLTHSQRMIPRRWVWERALLLQGACESSHSCSCSRSQRHAAPPQTGRPLAPQPVEGACLEVTPASRPARRTAMRVTTQAGPSVALTLRTPPWLVSLLVGTAWRSQRVPHARWPVRRIVLRAPHAAWISPGLFVQPRAVPANKMRRVQRRRPATPRTARAARPFRAACCVAFARAMPAPATRVYR
jgi:hypothetical protein